MIQKKNENTHYVPDLKAIVLAAGKGKRLYSEQTDEPKVLRQAAGKPLLSWVLEHLSFIRPSDVVLVVGFQAEKVMQAMGEAYTYVLQEKQLGTGHAVAAAEEVLAGYTGDVLVAYGDMPLLKEKTYYNLVMMHKEGQADCTLLTAITSRIPAYGRIIRDANGRFLEIVEQKDCTPEQLLINEVNPGIYAFRSEALFATLKELNNNNAQGEYYLTDVPMLMRKAGLRIETDTLYSEDEILGVNTPEDLERCTRLLQEEK
jgi:UDP-N-acetylglucosamine diphosphorylase/glucosamine-1-phosphate N-acetyltransferase